MTVRKLAAALQHAKAIGATVVFAKLDRLTRNVDLLRTLVTSGVDSGVTATCRTSRYSAVRKMISRRRNSNSVGSARYSNAQSSTGRASG